MWKIKEVIHENPLLNHIHLFSNRMSCKVYPNLGGSLQELRIDNTDLIDGIAADESGIEDYRGTFKSAILFPFPNRIKDGQYSFGGVNYQLEVNDTSFGNAIHGLVHDKSFSFQQETGNTEKARLVLTYESKGSDEPGYPFAYRLRLIYEFNNNGKASLGFGVKNTGEGALPFGLGWHPYFPAENLDQSTISFEAQDHFVCPTQMIPSEKEPAGLKNSFMLEDLQFDDGYSLKKPACSFDTQSYSLAMDFETDESSFLQVYTPKHRKSIAIEPMTCVTDAFNNEIGLEILEPGKEFRWDINMTIQTKN